MWEPSLGWYTHAYIKIRNDMEAGVDNDAPEHDNVDRLQAVHAIVASCEAKPRPRQQQTSLVLHLVLPVARISCSAAV